MKSWLALAVCGLFGVCTVAQEAQKPVEAQDKPAQAQPVAAKSGGDATKLVNPVKTTAESLASGKKTYALDCEMCHGKAGAGDGDLAADMKLKLKDYRDPTALKDVTDGELYSIILNGKGQMTGEEGRLKEHQIWNLVNYVRSLAKSKT
jgi:mono/diheme cytochrome c family protein